MPLSKEYILTLLKTPKIGQVSAKAIISQATFNVTTINELYDLIVDTKRIKSKIPLPERTSLENANILAQQMLDECEKQSVSVITVNDALYPIKLKRLSDYPIITYIKGSTSALSSDLTAAVIGTREPSQFGLKAGKQVSCILGQNGFTIISGLAIGCDTAGHLGALDAGTPTIAVLASGVNIIYPKDNQYLADRIIATGGALFSEYELNVRPQKSSFVERDRLQAGLSNGLVVVETDIKGGTMHTVGFAQKMNIPIGCISNHPESLKNFEKIKGNKYLIEKGAYSIGNPQQIFEFIKKLNPNATEFISDDRSKENLVNKQTEEAAKAIIDENKKKSVSTTQPETSPTKDNVMQVSKDGIIKSDDAKGVKDDEPLGSSVKELRELKELMARLITEQQATNNLLYKLVSQSNSKNKTSKTNKSNQPRLL